MQGQYKSTLQCPNCSRVSITFDPYMSIPLPIPNNFAIQFFFMPYVVSKKIYKYDLNIAMADTMMSVKTKMAKLISKCNNSYISPYDFVIG